MFVCRIWSDLFLEMILYGSIQVNLKDHLWSELKVTFTKLKLNYYPDSTAQENELGCVLCCNCPALIILVLWATSPYSCHIVCYSFTLSHTCSLTWFILYVQSVSLQGLYLFLSLFVLGVYFSLLYFASGLCNFKIFWLKPCEKCISISRCITFLIYSYQELIRYQSLGSSSEEQYLSLWRLSIRVLFINSICNVEKTYQWVMISVTLSKGQNTFINMAVS